MPIYLSFSRAGFFLIKLMMVLAAGLLNSMGWGYQLNINGRRLKKKSLIYKGF